jgi:predicted Co/Zn/Cd cation transporter (cation efflux family)
MGQRLVTAINGAIVILLMVQMWLLTAALESFLAGHREAAIPAALISGALFLACLGPYLLVDRLDREARKD